MRTALVSRHRLVFCLLLLLTAGAARQRLAAQPYWAGPAFLSATGLRALLVVPLKLAGAASSGSAGAASGESAGAVPGGGIGLCLAVEGIRPLAGWQVGLELDYAWHTGGDSVFVSQALAGLELSRRIPVVGAFGLRPGLSAGVGVTLLPELSPGFMAGLGLELYIHAGKRNFIKVKPGLRWLPGTAEPWLVTVAFGIRNEVVWPQSLPKTEVALGGLPELYSPDGDGLNDNFTIDLAFGPAEWLRWWSLRVVDKQNALVIELAGSRMADGQGKVQANDRPAGPAGSPADRGGQVSLNLAWDGLSATGELVEPATEYRLALELEDVNGRQERYWWPFMVDILVFRQGDRYKIRIPPIVFPANEADLARVRTDWMIAQNRDILERLLRLFSRFPGYTVVVEGHANSVYWQNPAAFGREQTRDLLPLSEARARAVRDALVALGFDAGRIKTEALGGSEPLVPFANVEEAWRNRRVEFVLVREAAE